MARIVNVIHKPHLVTYRVCEGSEYRCCAVCSYKVVVEKDNGSLIVASVLDDYDLMEFDIDEAIRKVARADQNEDCFYPFERIVGGKDFDSFVNGHIEDGSDVIKSFDETIDALLESNHRVTDDLRRRLESLAGRIGKLLSEQP